VRRKRQEIVVTANLTPRKWLAFKTPFQVSLPKSEKTSKFASINHYNSRSNPRPPLRIFNPSRVQRLIGRVAHDSRRR
jgi:hypothetical protein